MTTIRFTSLGVDANVTVDVGEGERRTLLSIAKEHGIPLPFRCEAGDCPTCLIHIETLSGGRRPVARLTDKESTLLKAIYLLSQHDIERRRAAGRIAACSPRLPLRGSGREDRRFFESDAGRR